MFSVIIPLYNKEKFIAATITSVLAQTFTQFELIIVDDASTDNSVALASAFLQDTRVKIIQQKNSGVSAARNNGIKNAGFPFIAFLDADDLWHPQFLEQMQAAWARHNEFGIIGAGIKRINAFEQPEFPLYAGPLELHPVSNYFKNNPYGFTSSSVTIKKTVFEQSGLFDESLTHGEDLDVWFRIMVQQQGGYISETLAFYSFAPVVATGKYDFLPDIKKHLVGSILDKYKSWLDGTKPSPEGFVPFVYHYCLSTLMAYYYYKDYRKEGDRILKQIPFRYRYNRLRDCLYFLPFKIGKKNVCCFKLAF